ncbi:hypothetical protein DCE93_06905 [Agromyces badenianii]|uniref:Uncharacterized protein n=1 Tax=Agromyces badenianii TaxID=2080742 RepID=A0A2S0WVV3_9MICO|nr:hypothetical protein [Agromyces badenianii]AWB95420.1 hypothetical protein DCE93_06905 [Agromyces badenianii]
MQTNTKLRRGLLAGLAATAVAAVAFGATAPANADPAGAPTYRTLAGVGSDTTQDLNNGLASVVAIGGSLALGSYDATGSATIQTKSGGTVFNRPNGSGSGVTALKSAKDATTLWGGQNLVDTDVQFARSSSAAAWTPSGAYSYIPLALDAVTYATASTTAVPNGIPLGTSTGQDSDSDGVLDLTLRNIYTRGATTTLENASNVGFTVGAQGSGANIIPFIPQAGSGTRSFWISQVGGSIGSIVSPTYTDGSGTHDVQEHDGSVTAAVTNALVPFSIAQHIAQGNSATLASNYGVTVTDRRNGAVLRSVGAVAPLASGVLNPAFPIARPVFTVVKYAELATNTALAAVFQNDTALAYNATRPGSSNLVITDFGFGDLTGGVTIGGVTYNPGDTTSYRAN